MRPQSGELLKAMGGLSDKVSVCCHQQIKNKRRFSEKKTEDFFNHAQY